VAVFFVAASAEVGGAPDVSMTKWSACNSGGGTCSTAKPRLPLSTMSFRQALIPHRPPLSSVSFLPDKHRERLHDDQAVIVRARSAVKSRLSG
jgi:hypothetical protein